MKKTKKQWLTVFRNEADKLLEEISKQYDKKKEQM